MKKIKSIILFACFTVILAMGVNEAVSILNTTDTVQAASSKKKKVTKVSQKRTAIVNYAKKYRGARYVWGGTSLKRGVDCSGFVQAVYKKMGYKLPRTSRQQSQKGKKVSAKNLQKGDLLFYGSGRSISHVAMYIGNNKIIHASNPRDGVKISKYNYRKPITIRRIIN
ncbi:MAG: C40 family peptidase [bacterium]|nr:C40 family peptidase [bacterium]